MFETFSQLLIRAKDSKHSGQRGCSTLSKYIYLSLGVAALAAIIALYFTFSPWYVPSAKSYDLSNPAVISAGLNVFTAPEPFEIGDTIRGEVIFQYAQLPGSSIPYFQIVHHSDYEQLFRIGPRIPNPLYDSDRVYILNSTAMTVSVSFAVTRIPVLGQYYFVLNGYGASQMQLDLTVERFSRSPILLEL
jgi:hypothetical protein